MCIIYLDLVATTSFEYQVMRDSSRLKFPWDADGESKAAHFGRWLPHNEWTYRFITKYFQSDFPENQNNNLNALAPVPGHSIYLFNSRVSPIATI